jgi:hypothetical protein
LLHGFNLLRRCKTTAAPSVQIPLDRFRRVIRFNPTMNTCGCHVTSFDYMKKRDDTCQDSQNTPNMENHASDVSDFHPGV